MNDLWQYSHLTRPGTLVALLSTGFGSELALAVIAII